MSALEFSLGIGPRFMMDDQVLLICKAGFLYLKLTGTLKHIAVALFFHYGEMSSLDYAYENTNCSFLQCIINEDLSTPRH